MITILTPGTPIRVEGRRGIWTVIRDPGGQLIPIRRGRETTTAPRTHITPDERRGMTTTHPTPHQPPIAIILPADEAEHHEFPVTGAGDLYTWAVRRALWRADYQDAE